MTEDHSKVSRRSILAFSAVLFLPAVSPVSAVVAGDDGAGLSGMLPRQLQAAAAIGRSYLQAYPSENDPGRLQALLFSKPMKEACPDTICQWLRELSHSDFLVRKVVHIDGWVLARSEARACALAYLTHRRLFA